MANVFTLFGELKADTKQFESSLRQAESRLKSTKGELDAVEKKTRDVGDTSAVTARNVQKLNEKLNEQKARLTAATSAFNAGEISAKKFQSTINSASNSVNSLSSRSKDMSARLTDAATRAGNLRNKIDGLSQGMTAAGGTMTAALTAPLVALGIASFKSASSLDTLRNKLTAATGSIQAGSAKLDELRRIAQSSAGVFTSTAADLYAYFRPMKFGEESINNLIKAFGRLQLADSKFEGMEFGRNMTQLFSQNFELQDLKQAIGQFPRFGELISKAFNIEGSDLDSVQKGLQGLKATGKLTGEQFMQGLANAVNNDATYGLLRDTVGTRMTKAFERIQFALEPLGQSIIDALEPVVDAVIPIIERMGEAFKSLSQPAQLAVLAIAGIAAAIGPVILAVGAFAGAAVQIGAAVTALGGMAAVAPVVGYVAAALAAVGLAAGALYLAWQTNFGGIRDFAQTVATAVQSLWSQAMTAIDQATGEATAAISQYWDENGADIMEAVGRVSAFVKRALDNIAQFWMENGDTIKAIASSLWSAIKVVFANIFSLIGNTIKLVAAIINGDWAKAWEAFKQIIADAIRNSANMIMSLASLVWNAVKLLAAGILNALKFAAKEVYNVGVNIVEGLINGMESRFSTAITKANNFVKQLIFVFQTIPKISSPSKVTTAYGQYIVEGLIVGMENRSGAAINAAGAIAKAVTEQFKSAQETLSSLLTGNAATVEGYSGGLGLQLQISNAEAVKQQLEDLIRLRIELNANLNQPLVNVAEELAGLQKVKETFSDMVSSVSAFAEKKPTLDDFLKLFSDPAATKLIEDRAKALGTTVDALERAVQLASASETLKELLGNATETGRGGDQFQQGLGDPIIDVYADEVPQVKAVWQDFFQSFFLGITQMKESMMSVKASIGENLLNSIASIGDVFGNAVANWDGTAQGFFKSLAQGFRALISQLISELIRLMVMKAVLSLLGNIAGGGGDPGSPGTASAGGGMSGGGGHGGGHATGGLITGAGTGTSDSIPARLSDGEFVMPAKSVKKFGLGFMESIRHLATPQMSLAGAGGMMGGMTTNNNQRSNVFNINVSGGGSREESQRTATQVRREILAALQREERR